MGEPMDSKNHLQMMSESPCFLFLMGFIKPSLSNKPWGSTAICFCAAHLFRCQKIDVMFSSPRCMVLFCSSIFMYFQHQYYNIAAGRWKWYGAFCRRMICTLWCIACAEQKLPKLPTKTTTAKPSSSPEVYKTLKQICQLKKFSCDLGQLSLTSKEISLDFVKIGTSIRKKIRILSF